MKNKPSCIAFCVFSFIFLIIPIALDARGIIGERFIGISVGVERPGDSFVRSIDDSVFSGGVGLNIPVDQNISWSTSFGFARLDGSFTQEGFLIDVEGTAIGAQTGPVYQFLPEEQINPYVFGGAGFVRSKVEAKFMGFKEKETETDFAFSVGGGVEISVGDRVAVLPEIYYFRVGNEDDFVGAVSGILWITDAFFTSARVFYGFDEGNSGVSVGVALTF